MLLTLRREEGAPLEVPSHVTVTFGGGPALIWLPSNEGKDDLEVDWVCSVDPFAEGGLDLGC